MKLEFYKYQGNGNDFIILDNRINAVVPDRNRIARLCDRHFGIGADGLLLLENQAAYDFSLKYFNSDGNESTMCGNGGRCMAALAARLGIIDKKTRFVAIDGPHDAEILSQNGNECVVRLRMKDTRPGKKFKDGYFIDTGSPHFVKFVPSVEQTDVVNEGRKLRYDKRFGTEGCNVNFVEYKSGAIRVRTYERGVENETLSCGTGVTASALITAFLHSGKKGFYRVKAAGGDFNVQFHKAGPEFTEVFLEGPATFVFKGEFTL